MKKLNGRNSSLSCLLELSVLEMRPIFFNRPLPTSRPVMIKSVQLNAFYG